MRKSIVVGFSCGKAVRFNEHDIVQLFESVFSNTVVKDYARNLRPGQVVLGIGRVDWVSPYAAPQN